MISFRLAPRIGSSENQVAVILAPMYSLMSMMFWRESLSKTAGGTLGVNVMSLMYPSVSSGVLSWVSRNGFSQNDSHFDRENRECSRVMGKTTRSTNRFVS